MLELVERCLADRAGCRSGLSRRLTSSWPWLSGKPLRQAVAAKKVGALRQLRTSANDVDLADAADELTSFTEQLAFLHLDFAHIHIIH